MAKSVIHQRLTILFDTWAQRASEDPNYSDALGEDGKPAEDYGSVCATHLLQLADELDAKGLLPTVPQQFGKSSWVTTPDVPLCDD